MSEPKGEFVANVSVKAVHSNLAQEVIQITVDRLKLILQNHLTKVIKSRDWQAPLGILITMLIVFPTTDFKLFIGIKGEIWQAMFYFAAITVFVWLGKTVYNICKSPSLDSLIEKIKEGNDLTE